MTQFTTLLQSETAEAAPSATAAANPQSRIRLPMRPVKIGVGCTLLLAGVYGLVSDRQFVSTDNAVVTAYITELRSPINGVLSGMPTAAGGLYEQGSMLATVDDRLADQQQLDNLGLLEQQAANGSAAAQAEQAMLQAQEKGLLDRSATQLQAVSSRLRQQQVEAERLLAARIADLEEARRELVRGRQLHEAGILPDSEYEKLQSRCTVAEAEEAAQQAAIAAVAIELQAAGRGVLSEPGINSDVPYSRQRADEVQMRLAEVERSRTSLQKQAEETRSNIDAETTRMANLRHSELLSPLAGMLWKLEAVNGERVAAGDTVARLVACDQSFVLAEISQDRVPDIAVGAQTRLRLTGETRERFGQVLAINGDPQLDNERKLAAFPARDPRQRLATARISIDRGSGECPIGRSARVLIATGGGSLFDRIWKHNP